jgi:hypothetical protein
LLVGGLAAGLVALGAAGRAEARLIDFRAGGLAGGMTGWGSSSTTPDFFNKTGGAAAGFELGAKLLIFDGSVRFAQVFDTGGTVGTLTQFLLGIAIDVPVGKAATPQGRAIDIFRPSLVGGFGLGTSGPVSPPLTGDQVSDKGVISTLKLGYEHFLNPFLGVGVEGDIGYHYFFGGQVITNVQDHSSGYQIAGFGTLTFHLGY